MNRKTLAGRTSNALKLFLNRRRHSSNFSFVPTPEMKHRPSEEVEASVPDMPDVSKGPRLYSEMIRPENVCDVLLRPSFNDIIITALADGASFTGDKNYKLTSKTSINSSQFLFANIATKWIDDFNSLLIELQEIPKNKFPLTFLSGSKTEAMNEKFDPKSVNSLHEVEAFVRSVMPEYSLESVIEFLLTSKAFSSDVAKYSLVIEYLTHNVSSLSRQQLPDFLDCITRNAEQSSVREKATQVDSFVSDSILSVYPDVLNELNPETLDRLAAFATYTQDLEAAKKALTILAHEHKLAPRKDTFKQFIAVYSKSARQNELTKEQILKDLTCIKPIFFYYGLDADSFELLLSRVINNSYDLAQFVRLALIENSAELLSEYAEHILLRLHHIHKSSSRPRIVKAVETTQFVRLLIHDYGVNMSERLKAVLQMMSQEYGVQFDELHMTNTSS